MNCLQTGKHEGKTVDEVMQTDPGYVWFLCKKNLSYVQQLKYQQFFDSLPDEVVARAEELTKDKNPPTVRSHQMHTPGGWRGW